MQHEIELAVHVAALPLLSVLAVVSAVRDSAVQARLRSDEGVADRAVAWDRLSPELRALAVEWTYAR